jgi:hypothetical protein
MANDEHSTPAPAGNSERAVHLIAQALDDAKSLTTGLERLHAFSNKTKLENQLNFIIPLAFHSADAQSYMEVVLEKVSR